MSWHCANPDCERVHASDTPEPEVCEVCRLEAERDEAIARGVRLWEWAVENEVWHDALSALQDAEQDELFVGADLPACCYRCWHEAAQGGNPKRIVLRDRMWLCPDCGNKRCPRATDHREECSGTNDPDQRPAKWSPLAAAELEHYAAGIHVERQRRANAGASRTIGSSDETADSTASVWSVHPDGEECWEGEEE